MIILNINGIKCSKIDFHTLESRDAYKVLNELCPLLPRLNELNFKLSLPQEIFEEFVCAKIYAQRWERIIEMTRMLGDASPKEFIKPTSILENICAIPSGELVLKELLSKGYTVTKDQLRHLKIKTPIEGITCIKR